MGLKRVSGLWLKDGKTGKFMSGQLRDPIPSGAKVLVFKNQNKRSDSDPDYTLNVADDSDDQNSASKPASGKQRANVSKGDERDALSDFESARRSVSGGDDRIPF